MAIVALRFPLLRLFLTVHEKAHIQDNISPLSSLSLGSHIPFFPNSLSFSLLWRWLCCTEALTWRCWKVCWTGSLGSRVSHCPGAEHSSSHRDHLLMDVCQLAHLFLWYCYFRGKKRPAGFKKYVYQKLSLLSVKLRQPISICMIEY